MQSLLAAPETTLHLREEGIPLAVTIADDTVHMLLRDETGVLRASIDTFNHYWRTATELEKSDFGG